MTDRYADLLAATLEFEVTADDWDSLPVVAMVYGNRQQLDAVPVWIPTAVWEAAQADPNRVLLVLSAAMMATGTVPLIRPPEFPTLHGVAIWANAWVAPNDDAPPPEHPDRAESKVALFAHLDRKRWRAVTRERSTGLVEFMSSADRGVKSGGPLLRVLQTVADVARIARLESHT